MFKNQRKTSNLVTLYVNNAMRNYTQVIISFGDKQTEALANGRPVPGAGIHLVEDRFGHSDISTTLRISAHIQPEQKQEVADLFARAIENG